VASESNLGKHDSLREQGKGIVLIGKLLFYNSKKYAWKFPNGNGYRACMYMSVFTKAQNVKIYL
jgi:hypothetical protein